MTWTLLEANGTSRALPVVVSISPPRTELDDRVLWTSRVAIVAFEAIAAGEAALRFIARLLLLEPAQYLFEPAQSLGGSKGLLGSGIDICEDRKVEHCE
jgi:hypothetical protein